LLNLSRKSITFGETNRAKDKKRKGKKSGAKRKRGYECAFALVLYLDVAAAWHRQARGRQRTRNYRRGYIPALSLPSPHSRNFAPSTRPPRERTDTSYDVFCSGTKDCTVRIASPLFSAILPPAFIRPLKSSYRSAKSGDYPRTIVPGVYESVRPVATCPLIARLDTLVIATAELPPASPASSNLPSFAALLGRVYRRRQAISDEPRGASCEMGGRPL